MPSTILVTGGAGYIGSHTILELLNAGHSVICVDNCYNSFIEEGSDLPESLKRVQTITGKKIIFYLVDVGDKVALDEVFKKNKIDCVFHLAAMKSVGKSATMPMKYYQNNLFGLFNLLEVMKANGVLKLVFSSSATVYGEPKFLPITEEHPIGNCTNPYGKTKHFSEEVLQDLSLSDKAWKIIILRFFNPAGAHQSGLIGEDPNGEPNNLMPYVAQVAVGRLKQLRIFGDDFDTPDGTGVRDFIHILDLASGHLAALNKLNSDSFEGLEVYNLGSGSGFSVLEIIKSFSEASEREIPYEFAPRRIGDVASCYSTTVKAEKELGWTAKKGLKEMCEDYWRWQKNNPNGFAPLKI